MSAISEALGNSAPPHEFSHGDTTYLVRLVDQGVKVAVEKRLLADAREILRMEKEDDGLNEEDYARRRQTLNYDFMAGEFAFEGDRGRRYLQTQRGALHLAALLFQCDEMEMMRLMAARGPEVASMVDLALRESFPGMKAAPEKKTPG